MSARTRELFGLLPVSLLVAAGFAAVLTTRTADVSDATLTYGAVFLRELALPRAERRAARAERRAEDAIRLERDNPYSAERRADKIEAERRRNNLFGGH